MPKIMFGGLLSLLILSGGVLAQQSGEQKRGSSMQDMMQEMMKGGKTGEKGMEGMMRMMKMMDQCGRMMEQCCPTAESGETREGEKK